jgi:hypothetical protein
MNQNLVLTDHGTSRIDPLPNRIDPLPNKIDPNSRIDPKSHMINPRSLRIDRSPTGSKIPSLLRLIIITIDPKILRIGS